MAAARYREDADTGVAAPPQRSDAYTGMLIISLAAMVLGCILLLLEFLSYDGDTKPPPVNLGAPVQRAPAPAGPGPAVGGAPTAPAVPPPGR
jgi:hypothetical protein